MQSDFVKYKIMCASNINAKMMTNQKTISDKIDSSIHSFQNLVVENNPESCNNLRISCLSMRNLSFVVLSSPLQFALNALIPSSFNKLLSLKNSYCSLLNFVNPHVSPISAACF